MSRSCLLALAVLCSVAFAPAMAFAQDSDDNMVLEARPIVLLQPFTGQTELQPSNGIEIFFEYFNTIWPWALGTAAGIAVLRVLIAGVQIMTSRGGDIGEAKEHLMWAIVGLIMLILAGFILRTLNPLFYQ